MHACIEGSYTSGDWGNAKCSNFMFKTTPMDQTNSLGLTLARESTVKLGNIPRDVVYSTCFLWRRKILIGTYIYIYIIYLLNIQRRVTDMSCSHMNCSCRVHDALDLYRLEWWLVIMPTITVKPLLSESKYTNAIWFWQPNVWMYCHSVTFGHGHLQEMFFAFYTVVI